MADTLDPAPKVAITSDLTGGGTVEFDITDTGQLDTPEENPIEFWLKVFPTAQEGPAD